MGRSAQTQFGKVTPCPLMQQSFITKPPLNMMPHSIGTWIAVRMPLSDSMLRWIAR